MRCPACPVAYDRACFGESRPTMCAWAASGDPVKRQHVVNRSAIAEGTAPLDPASFPPLLEQAGNLATAVGRFVASGLERSTPEERARRLAICRECEHFAEGRCRKCGCFLMAKIRAASEHCPLDPPKW